MASDADRASDPRAQLVSVIVPALNAVDTLAAQLEALRHQQDAGPFEVLVVDNGSTDGTRELVERTAAGWAELRLVDASTRRGVSFARNAGAAEASGGLLLFCDADDVVSPHWVAAMRAALAGADAVGGRLDVERLNDPDDRRLRAPRADSLETGAMNWLPYAVGANCGVARTPFSAVSGFGEEYSGGGDDTEFFWRVQLAGFKLAFAPDAVVHYRLRQGASATWSQFFHYGRSQAQLYRDFGHLGMPRSGLVGLLRAIAGVVVRTPARIWTPAGRADLARTISFRAGRLAGSIRFHVWYP